VIDVVVERRNIGLYDILDRRVLRPEQNAVGVASGVSSARVCQRRVGERLVCLGGAVHLVFRLGHEEVRQRPVCNSLGKSPNRHWSAAGFGLGNSDHKTPASRQPSLELTGQPGGELRSVVLQLGGTRRGRHEVFHRVGLPARSPFQIKPEQNIRRHRSHARMKARAATTFDDRERVLKAVHRLGKWCRDDRDLGLRFAGARRWYGVASEDPSADDGQSEPDLSGDEHERREGRDRKACGESLPGGDLPSHSPVVYSSPQGSTMGVRSTTVADRRGAACRGRLRSATPYVFWRIRIDPEARA
jgi:hypothetical protein